MSRFPKDFLWGSATNAQQFEGGYNEGGKGLSISDVRQIKTNTLTPSNFDKFKVASDHYHHLEEDIDLLGEMGMQIYRFSMSWTRIFPNGDDETPNQAGLDFYDRMITRLEKNHIVPVCTLYAYDLPLSLLQRYNGWMDRRCIDAYLNYVKTVATYFKGRIKYYIPFNEHNFLFIDSEYMTGYEAKNSREIFQLEHHFNLAFAKASVLIHECDPEAKVTANLGSTCYYPKTCKPEDVKACDFIYHRTAIAFGDALIRGEYTKKYLNYFKEDPIEDLIHEGDLEAIAKVETDLLSATYYASSAIEVESLNHLSGINVNAKNPYLKQTPWGWNLDPYGFKHMLEDFYHRYQIPILITECGLSAYDKISEDGKIHDEYRIDYLKDHISSMADAIEEGVEIEGFMTWSAIDLYSTREGLAKRYGFIYVDETTFERKKKESFYWYKKIMETNAEGL